AGSRVLPPQHAEIAFAHSSSVIDLEDVVSYYTRLEVTWDDTGAVDETDIIAAADSFLARGGLHKDVLSDLKEALRGFSAPGFNRVPGPLIEMMMLHVSAAIPDVTFYVRAVGEEFNDVWMRQICAGKIVFGQGPFDEGDS